MADQDFQINIKTVADTTGIQLTKQGLDAIKTAAKEGNQEAIAALQKLSGAVKEARSTELGFGGSAVGIGTFIGLLTKAISAVRAFDEEQNRMVDGMIKMEQHLRAAGDAIIDFQDKAINARRVATEPLAQTYVRLQQEVVRLNTEMSLLNLPSQSEEWKKLNTELAQTQSELAKVTAELEEQAKKGGPQTAQPITPAPKAGKGESQQLVDQMESNRKAFEESQKQDVWEFDPETGGYKLSGQKQFPTFQPPPQPPLTNPAPNENMLPGAAGSGKQPLTLDLIRQAFEQAMLKYWGP